MEEHRFHLEKYNTPSSRYDCPKCHGKKCFVRYIDSLGEIQFPDYVGRCNHEHHCQYHFTPKQYFAENEEVRTQLAKKQDTWEMSKPIETPSVKTYYFDNDIMKKSEAQYDKNNLSIFLTNKFGKERVTDVLKKYHVGTARRWEGATVYWQVDARQKVRTAKIMLYDPLTGHRSKDPKHHVTWLHALQHIDSSSISQCFFGEHLLRENTTGNIAIVESEKTAIVASLFLPDFTWIASGGKHGMLNKADLGLFTDKRVVLFPDLGGLKEWQKKSAEWISCGVKSSVFSFLEENASEDEIAQGLDISDYLLQCDSLDILP